MKKLKLFQKTYIFTMMLIGVIIIISHTLIYIMLPSFYTNEKRTELDNISMQIIKNLEANDDNEALNIADDFSKKYDLNITLNIGEKSYLYEGIDKFDVYVDPELLKKESLILTEFEKGTSLGRLNNSSNEIKKNENNLSMKEHSVINKREFKTVNNVRGSVSIVMDLQSLKEASGIVFNILPYSVVISLIISLFASYIYVKIITNPIKEICNVTRKMKALNKDAYCNINTGDEMETLATDINSLYKTLWNTIYSLKQEIESVSKLEKSKVDFLRSASHELKTPLMSIHIMLENMIYNIGKYKNHDIYLLKCKEEITNLSNMVQEILDTSRLNTWNNQEDHKTINLRNLLKKIIDPYIIMAKYNNINMSIDYSKTLIIESDEKLLCKALSNIISNAVSYTDEGKSIIIYFDNNALVIENQCRPIQEEHLIHIFDAFYRVEFDRNKSLKGNGLGLYIVKQILENINIKYSFESTELGMKFTMIFT